MDNKKSETLRQREKAQRDLLELKKIQMGQIDAGVLNDDDKKIVPKTLDEKCDNFFYHNKFKLIAVAALAIILTVLIVSCVTKTDYDATVTIYCYEYVDSATIEDTAAWLEKLHRDTNENGKTEILCTDCSFAQDTDLAQTVTQQQMKIQAILTDAEAVLFILDEESLEYLNGISENFTLFKEENIVELSEDYYEALRDERISFKDEKKRYLCLRTIDESVIEGRAEKNYNDAKAVINSLQ